MRNSYVKKIYNNLLTDENYIKYCKIYKEEHYIDLDLLKSLLETHHELYYTFLKINILFYFQQEKILKRINKELKNWKYVNGRILRVDDVDLILRHYHTNYSRCRSSMMKIVEYKLVSKVEQEILLLIYGKDIKDLILPILENEE